MEPEREVAEVRPFRIFIVDDHPLVREGLAARIESQSDLRVCGGAGSAQETLGRLSEVAADLVVVDIQLQGSHGLELIKDIRRRFPEMKMLVVSAFDESLFAERSIRAGAHGYINKCELQDDVIVALRTVLGGGTYLSPKMSQRLVSQQSGGDPAEVQNPIERLSDREMQVFQLIGHGKTTKAIAQQLFLSPHTIDTHREKIRHKLGAKNGVELMQLAVQWVLENQ